MQYERLVQWARETWQARWGDQPYVTVWASTECSNMIAQSQVKTGRKLRGKLRYDGAEPLDCPYIVPISDYGSRGKRWSSRRAPVHSPSSSRKMAAMPLRRSTPAHISATMCRI
ncbi:MAG: hypothetical protein IPO91_32705 [Chloroflexi bacterium]|nr:hypothetical protein [Chloroflexota bacterium]